jgi:hypothetical protein
MLPYPAHTTIFVNSSKRPGEGVIETPDKNAAAFMNRL